MIVPGSANAGLIFGPGTLSLYDAITAAGLTANLKLCLDAGDSESWGSFVHSHTNQEWDDRSGNDYWFTVGSATTTGTDDPTFNGTIGGLSAEEYFALDGGDYFVYNTTNPTWVETLHKDSAKFTILVAFYTGGLSTSTGLFGSVSSSGNGNGIAGFINTNGTLRLLVLNAGNNVLSVSSSDMVSANAWSIIAFSLDETVGTGGGFLWNNGSYVQVSSSDTFTSTYSSPSTGSASSAMNLCAWGQGGLKAPANNRIAGAAMWQGVALNKTQLDSLFYLTRDRFAL